MTVTEQDGTPIIGRDDLVRYQRWTGRVYEVLSDGSVLIDWSGHTQGFDHPFFHGPYQSEEVERV